MEYPSSLSFPPPSEEREWVWLPENILFLILSHLFLLSEMFSFGSVCTRWYSVLKHRLRELRIQPNMSFRRNLPMLLTPAFDSSKSTRNLFSVADSAIYDLKLPVPYNNRCIGSSHGWLIFLNSVSFVITLFNPFYFGSSKGTIHLPRFVLAEDMSDMRMKKDTEFYSDYFIGKAVLSFGPSSSTDDYYMMVIYGEMRNLAYYSSENSTWTYLNSPQGIFDIIYHHSNFLAVDDWGEVFVCDVRSNYPITSLVTEPVMGPVGGATRRYIVEFKDGNTLLQAVRLVESAMNSANEILLKTIGFLVYKLEVWVDTFEWIPVTSIEGGALFLGDNYSTFVQASDFPGVLGNAIYFTADYYDSNSMFKKPSYIIGYRDSGVFHIENGVFLGQYIPYPQPNDLPPPIWVLPTI